MNNIIIINLGLIVDTVVDSNIMYNKIIVLLLVILSLVSGFQLNSHHHHHCMRSTRLAMAEIKVTKAVSEDIIKKLGMKGWPTWGCGISTFPWTYGDSETALIIKGNHHSY